MSRVVAVFVIVSVERSRQQGIADHPFVAAHDSFSRPYTALSSGNATAGSGVIVAGIAFS